MISNKRYWFLLFLILLVYLVGMFVTLFENDSAQFAVMAMRMVQENDFISLFKGPDPYLDKPHMHYWLAALSFKIFGLYDWAYRIPGILASLLGAYSCYGLGKLLYHREVGKLGSLIFLTAQTIVLANIDVRTDAVLTGFTIFSIWQLAAYIQLRSLKHMLLGAFGAGIAFSTKGQIALLVIGLPLLCHLVYTRKWVVFLSWKVLAGLLVFGLSISPMLYAYYLQFDQHPELVIRGKGNRSGIFFIFWEQSFERLSGEGVGKNSSDYLFFFHTFLWVFLPWTVLGLTAFWKRTRQFFATRFKAVAQQEFLTLGGITLIFLLISFAQFKLPHYLNIVIPLFAVLTASYIFSLKRDTDKRTMKVLLGIQYFILCLVFVVSLLLCYFVFKIESIYAHLLLLVLLLAMAYFSLKREAYFSRLITISVCASLLLNLVLNSNFYPSLLGYQAGSSMSKLVKEHKVPVDNIYKLSPRYTWSLDFYNKEPVKILDLENLGNRTGIWVYISDEEMEELKKRGFDWDQQFTVADFRITRLQARFLNPATRKGVLERRHLIHLQ